MTVGELISKIQEHIPETSALEWDNTGLLVGSKESEVDKVYLAVDATDEVIGEAIRTGCQMLLTHHPLIFGGCRRVVEQDLVGRRIITLIRHGLSCYAMHTNFDVEVMGMLAAEQFGLRDAKVLDVTMEDDAPKGIGCVASLQQEQTLEQVAERAKEVFHIPSVRIFGNGQTKIDRVAISPGSGKSEIETAVQAGADVLITGDIDHHTGIDAVARGLAIVDAGHYGVEYLYVDYMEEFLGKIAPELHVIKEKKQEPFWQL